VIQEFRELRGLSPLAWLIEVAKTLASLPPVRLRSRKECARREIVALCEKKCCIDMAARKWKEHGTEVEPKAVYSFRLKTMCGSTGFTRVGTIKSHGVTGTPTRARRPACLVPEHWIHSLTPRFVRGFRVHQAPPSLGGLARLSPQAAHDDWNPGRLGSRFHGIAIIVPTAPNPKPPDFVGFSKIAQFGQFGQLLDNVQIPRAPVKEFARQSCF